MIRIWTNMERRWHGFGGFRKKSAQIRIIRVPFSCEAHYSLFTVHCSLFPKLCV